MSEPEFLDRQKQPGLSRPNESSRPVQPLYRKIDPYHPDDSIRVSNLASSKSGLYKSPPPDPAAQMLQELTYLLRSFKDVMNQAKRFFGKYLPSEENHFKLGATQYVQMPVYQQQVEQQKSHYNQSNQYYGYEQSYQQNQYGNLDQSKASQSHVREPQKEKRWGFGKKPKNHDPNKPKAPLTPYFLFFSETRDILRQKYPEKSLSEIGALGGTIWRKLSEAQKQSYKDRYEEEKKKHKIKMDSYNASGGALSGQRTADYDSTNVQDF